MTDKIVKKYRCTAEARRTMGVKWKQFLGVVEEKKREKKKRKVEKKQMIIDKVVEEIAPQENPKCRREY